MHVFPLKKPAKYTLENLMLYVKYSITYIKEFF